MPILKFSVINNRIILDGCCIKDITEDKRTSMLDKKSFLKDEFKIDNNVYLALNDMFFKMAKIFDKSKTEINAMLIREENNHIIIVPSRSYVFWKGKSVEPTEYKITHSEMDIVKLLQIIV